MQYEIVLALQIHELAETAEFSCRAKREVFLEVESDCCISSYIQVLELVGAQIQINVNVLPINYYSTSTFLLDRYLHICYAG